MQASENNQINLDYAQEWITYLKRRNLVLTIIWPSLFVLLILASLAALYFYQEQQASNISLSIESEKNLSLEDVKKSLQSENAYLTSTNNELKSELEALINAREELSVLNSDSTSKLNITSQMVDNLNQLVAELKNEREELNTKLEDSLETIAQLQNKHQLFIKQLNKEKIDSEAGLNKQIDSRKSAYQALANRQQEMREDMNRLNSLANTKDKQIDKLKKDNQNLESHLKQKSIENENYKNKLTIIEKSYAELETKLNAIISPIGSNNSRGQESTNQEAPRTEASRKITGLEDIKKPVVETNNNPQSTDSGFDHNKISILP